MSISLEQVKLLLLDPKILKVSFKNILKNPIFKILKESVAEINLKSYLVGGFVRDLLIERQNKKDIDIVVVGSGIELANKSRKN